MTLEQRRHLRVVLLLTPPFWACMALWNIINTYLFIKIGQGSVQWDTPYERALQHLFMLPLLLIAYFMATEIHTRFRNWPAAVVPQLALALLFSLTYRPFLLLGYGIGNHESWRDILFYLGRVGFSPWAEMISESIWCFILYMFGLLLLLNTIIYLELRDERAHSEDLKSRWVSARLEALRGQLNPHFLFNCLNTVSSLIHVKPDKAKSLLIELSGLLRIMLEDRESEYVQVREELDYIRKYLSVEQTRFEDRLNLVIEADADVLEACIPNLILQPLVENAIKHGIATTRGQGDLRIVAERQAGHLALMVTNTYTSGRGVKPAGYGIGLRNVRERLTTIYHDHYEFVAGPTESGIWVARIILLPMPP